MAKKAKAAKVSPAAASANPMADLLMVLARAVERLTRIGNDDVHADVERAIAAVEAAERGADADPA